MKFLRDHWLLLLALALLALGLWLKFRKRGPSGTVTVGAAGKVVPFASLPLTGEHETIGGQEVVGAYGLDYS